MKPVMYADLKGFKVNKNIVTGNYLIEIHTNQISPKDITLFKQKGYKEFKY